MKQKGLGSFCVEDMHQFRRAESFYVGAVGGADPWDAAKAYE
jgi:hypothetical protein